MIDISKKFQKGLKVQSYGKRPNIEGVRLIDLKRHLDDGGEFSELGRLQGGALAGLPEFDVVQVNHSLMQPGAVKAWHVHHNQDDVWFVPPDERLLVGLLDIRAGSATEGVTVRLVLGDGVARLLYIPRGVAHGAANPYPRAARILYLVNQAFDAGKPDEWRLPWDAAGAQFWDLERG